MVQDLERANRQDNPLMEKYSSKSEFLSHSDVSQNWAFNCDCLPKKNTIK